MFHLIERRKKDAKTPFDIEYINIFSKDTKVSGVLLTAFAFESYPYKYAISVELLLYNVSSDLICILRYEFNDSNFIYKVKELEKELSYSCLEISTLDKAYISSVVRESIYTCIRNKFPIINKSINYKNN